MTLFQSIIDCKAIESAEFADKMIGQADPSAIWAVLMHGASWHEQLDYDTPHSTILAHSIYGMIEDLGDNPDILLSDPEFGRVKVPDELKDDLQRALLERLANHLAEVDHWAPERGPRYGVDSDPDSLDNSVNRFVQAVREKSQVRALGAALRLTSKSPPVRLIKAASSLAAENPDSLGHGFIMPVSLLSKIPETRFTRPLEAVLWHLTEYLVRKVPQKRPTEFSVDDEPSKMAKSTNIEDQKLTIMRAVVEYGILGHNGIFAQRISEAARLGLVHNPTIKWLIKKLKENTGSSLKETQMDVDKLIKNGTGTDWKAKPSEIELPHSKSVIEWLNDNVGDYWNKMMDLKSSSFEEVIPSIGKKDWSIVRAAQYAMSALSGQPTASHVMIFTHSVWSLTDHGLLPEDLACLQVYRMLRQYLNDR